MQVWCRIEGGVMVERPRRLPRVWRDISDLHAYSEADLNALGWYRVLGVACVPFDSWQWSGSQVELNHVASALESYRSTYKRHLKKHADRELSQVVAEVPNHERETWMTQALEARSFSAGDAPPMLTEIATERGMLIDEIVTKVETKTSTYEVAAGKILGKLQRLEDQVDLAKASEIDSITW